MKKTLDGKRYNSARCERLGRLEHYHNGNYSGTTYLLRAADGVLLKYTESNGQDCYLQDDLRKLEYSHLSVDDFELTDEQEARCAELGLITLV